jgi:glycopeptide antibiotics resistance protein
MPLPFILIFVFKIYKGSTIIFLGFLLSFTIELLQYIFEVGYADIDDIILNTLGTAIGYLCFRAIKKWIPANVY